MPPSRIEVVHVGSAARDIASDDPRGWRLGGGVTYAALTTASLGLRTAAIVGMDEVAAGAHELDRLREAGVEIHRVALSEGPVFHNRETDAGRAQTCVARGVPIQPTPLPPELLGAPAWSLVPVADEVEDRWGEVPRPDAFVAVSWQGMLRRLVAGRPVERVAPRRRPLLRRADLVGLSHLDVDPSSSLGALTAFLRPGAHLLVTQGGHGGLLVTAAATAPLEVLRYLPLPTEGVVDPTGAGDVALAALLATRIRPDVVGSPNPSLARTLRFAAAAGSLAVEGIGLAGVPDLQAVRIRAERERVRRAVRPSASERVGVEDPRQ
jgi:sugar/nucleoside kinase (ribokinase family)